MPFPTGFHWGVATSAFQIEGSVAVDGRTDSNWDEFCRRPGTIERGENADVACDHYRRWEQDIELMAELGVGCYRFSVAWSRVMPGGDSQVNPAGLAFYDRLVDRLVASGIQPVVTLYHMDHPAELERTGGWLNREMVDRFATYAGTVFETLGDRVGMWFTINEPAACALHGCVRGTFPPGRTDDLEGYFRLSHHQLLAHGAAVQLSRQLGLGAPIGAVLGVSPTYPETQRRADVEAALAWDGLTNGLFLEGLVRGRYPEGALARLTREVDLDRIVLEGDLQVISEPTDLLGVNYYSHVVIRADDDATFGGVPVTTGVRTTEMGSEIVPDGLYEIVMRVADEYRVPIVISENGAAFADEPDEAGYVDDHDRVAYIRTHLRALEDAIADGADVHGYFVWSLLDNFEWMFGYRPRFGLVRVDFETQRRIPKASARFYSEVIRSNGALSG